jgi:hypothetical protein
MSSPNPWITVAVAAMGAGGVKYLYELVRGLVNRPPGALRKQGLVDANIASVALARDELVEDNVRLRQEIREQDIRHKEERARWLEDQKRLREDIARLEAQIIRERDDAATRYNHLLVQVQSLRQPKTHQEEGADDSGMV